MIKNLVHRIYANDIKIVGSKTLDFCCRIVGDFLGIGIPWDELFSMKKTHQIWGKSCFFVPTPEANLTVMAGKYLEDHPI